MNNNFCHLHVHSEFSVLDGLGSIPKYVSHAKSLGFEYLGLTDHGSVSGLIQFQKECDKQGIKPVLGCEAYIVPDAKIRAKDRKAAHIILFIKNETGWKEICKLLTKAWKEGFYYKPRIDFNSLLTCDLSGFVISTACLNSFINLPDGMKALETIKEKTDVYFEIMPHIFGKQKEFNDIMRNFINIHPDIELVATNDCHYITEEDADSHEVLLAIQTRSYWDDKKRWKFEAKELYLKTRSQMIRSFHKQGDFSSEEVKQALSNTVKIAEKCCDFRIPKKDISLPDICEGNPNRLLKSICYDNLNKLSTIIPARRYTERFKEEYELISKKNFSIYFLIIKDILNYCDEEHIGYGPGRGSVGGSLLAYLLGITKIDPLIYDLSFARFISEDRIDFPDIDIDFEKRFKPKIRTYLENKFGKNNVCGISTDIKMQSRGVIKDVSRVFGISDKEANKFTQQIPYKEHDRSLINEAIENTDEGKKFNEKYPHVIRHALNLEGQIKSLGQHAAAVVISKEDLTQDGRCVIERRKKDNKYINVCNWNMQDSEYVGLMKIDILGLATLSVIAECIRLIDDPSLDINNIPLDDKKVYKLINNKDTAGMFHINTSHSSNQCKEIRVNSIDDIAIALALVRTGPLSSGMTKNYIDRKRGLKWKPLHPIYEDLTKDTYGVLAFQEQVMKVISKVAGLSESTADKIRKIISKKRDPEEFKPYKKMFVKGCLNSNTLSKKEANDFWEGLLEWASYGFNKAHSVGYALIVYQTGWLKVNYPIEFICASLSYGEHDEGSNDIAKHRSPMLDKARELGYKIIPPKVGKSDATRWIFKDKDIYVPFIEIDNVGEVQALECTKKKQNKPRLEGFFGKEYSPPRDLSKIDQVLEDINAFSSEMPDRQALIDNFSFPIIPRR